MCPTMDTLHQFEEALPPESPLREDLEQVCIDTVFGAHGVQLLNERGLAVMEEAGVPVVPAHMLVEGQQWATPVSERTPHFGCRYSTFWRSIYVSAKLRLPQPYQRGGVRGLVIPCRSHIPAMSQDPSRLVSCARDCPETAVGVLQLVSVRGCCDVMWKQRPCLFLSTPVHDPPFVLFFRTRTDGTTRTSYPWSSSGFSTPWRVCHDV